MHHRTVRRKMTLEHMLSHLLLFKIIGGALAIDELYVSNYSNIISIFEYYLSKVTFPFLHSVVLIKE